MSENLTDNLQKALSIVTRLKLTKNNFFRWEYYYFSLGSLICITLHNFYYPAAVNTVQITVQIYSDIVQLFVQ